MAKAPLTTWFNKKIVDPFIQILQRGSDPHSVAFSAALGTTLGLFPICGNMGFERIRGYKKSVEDVVNSFSGIYWMLINFFFLVHYCQMFDNILIWFWPNLRFGLGFFPSWPRTPFAGVTVFLCALAIVLVGSLCHAPTVMLANFIATPIELSLVVPFLRLGEAITGGPHFPLTADALKKVLTGQASQKVLLSISHALLGWLVAAPFILAGLYVLFLPCFKVLLRKFGTASSIPLISPRDF